MKRHTISYKHLLLQMLIYDVFFSLLLILPYRFWLDTARSHASSWLRLIPLYIPAYVQLFVCILFMLCIFANFRWSQRYFNVRCGFVRLLFGGAIFCAILFSILFLPSLFIDVEKTTQICVILSLPGVTLYLAILSLTALANCNLVYFPLVPSAWTCLCLSVLNTLAFILPICIANLTSTEK